MDSKEIHSTSVGFTSFYATSRNETFDPSVVGFKPKARSSQSVPNATYLSPMCLVRSIFAAVQAHRKRTERPITKGVGNTGDIPTAVEIAKRSCKSREEVGDTFFFCMVYKGIPMTFSALETQYAFSTRTSLLSRALPTVYCLSSHERCLDSVHTRSDGYITVATGRLICFLLGALAYFMTPWYCS